VKRTLQILASSLFLGTLGMLALSALVWWIGPLVAVGDVRFLASTTARIVALAGLWSVWLAYVAVRIWRRRRRNAKLLEGIGEGQSAAGREAEVLQKRFSDAVSKMQSGPAWKRMVSGRNDGLYGMPWYIFIGAPGSGKTTALLNAGLNFVIEGDDKKVQGIGGTRNCDWWFTKDAVLIDTAGRYTLQESDRGVDSAAWDKFLSLLRQTRPRRPINGVLLTVNVQDLLQQNETMRREHALKLRTRLHELQTKLGVRPPVYVLVTKADLIAGFSESFEMLGKEERDQVWGFTFAAAAFDPANPLRDFDAEYRLLQERLNAGLIERMQAEKDPVRRGLMFGFGPEFGALRPLLQDFLERVFGSAGGLQEPVALRGVYFTSGTQDGTPIDRVMGNLARAFGMGGQASPPRGGRGRSYFLRRLLQDVVFSEAHLVSFSASAERRRRLLRTAGFSVVGLATLLLMAGWAVSYLRNARYTDEVAQRVPALRSAADALPTGGADPLPLLPVLDAASAAALPAEFAVQEPPLLSTLGLYQGSKLHEGAQAGYHKLLQHALAPRLVRRLEERLRAANRNNLEQAYEALKAYLMIQSPEHFNADALKAWIAVDWDAQLRQLTPEQRQALDRHLDALLALGAPSALARADAPLIAGARDMLASFPLEYRIYSRVQRRWRGEFPDFTVAGAGGPNAPKVLERASGEPLSRGVPGLYTREGYAKVFQQAQFARTAAQMASEESWVLGRGSPPGAAAALSTELEQRVRRLYLEDYARQWERLVADVRLVRLANLEASIDAARVLSAPDSPMANFLRAVARETTLVPAPQAPSVLDKAASAANKARNELSRLTEPSPAPAAGQRPIERIVDDRFASLHRLMQGQPAPIDDVSRLFSEVYVQLRAVDAAQKAKTAPPPMDTNKLKAAAGQLPPTVGAMLETLADAGSKQGRVAETGALAGELKPIQDFCLRAVANRYPLAQGARADVMPEDFGQLFGPGGLMDDFFQRKLAPLVDTSTTPWSYKPLPDGSRPAAQAALADFQRAARIRDVFFRAGNRTPAFRHDMRAIEITGDVQEVKLDLDGQVTTVTPGSAVTLPVPAPRAASLLRVQLGTSAPVQFEGPWAVYRMFDNFQYIPGSQPERFGLVITREGRQARFEVVANSAFNPYRMRELQQFRCPGSL
jgi:type VI secretion system protein ImpL